MFKKFLIVATLMTGGLLATPAKSEAAIVLGRIAPVRRVAARTVLPPYPMTRRVIAAPIYRPMVVGPVYRAPVIYGVPTIYGSGISVGIGY